MPKRKTPEHRGGEGDRDAVYYKNIDPKEKYRALQHLS
ncbi:hypothetical protein BAP_3642 [Bacillus sp. CN2]|nr:hypothetical protein BAP_3642 [Bacillus sp. CN2]